jgi:hypothetical protein
MHLSGFALTWTLAAFAALLAPAAPASAQPAATGAKKPNVLVIFGDDIGWFNPSFNHRGAMGYNVYNLRADPFERGPESFEYGKWMMDRAFLLVPSQAIVGQWLSSFKEFPIRQRPASFNLDSVMEKLSPHH